METRNDTVNRSGTNSTTSAGGAAAVTTDKLEKLGKYEIRQEIGRGSMGVVYEAYDPYIDRAVAVKVAMTTGVRDSSSKARFRKMFFNEAHTAGMLHHPNILEVFDAGIEDDNCYIVMELVAGSDTLKRYCSHKQLLPMADVAGIIFHCAKALDYAHRQGVIHRDIKPTNILLTQDGEVKIADFSIAHINSADFSQTMPMGFVGSPRYMSPEQIQEDIVTHKTDLFSLGLVAYELLTGRHPFGGRTFSSLVYRVINEPPTPMNQFRSDIAPAMEKIVRRALEKLPEKRYPMGVDLASELSSAFSHLEQPHAEISGQKKFNAVQPLAFFSGFNDTEIWEVVRAGVWEELDVDDVIIRENDVDDAFYILVSGAVTVTKHGVTIQQLGEGQCFGEMGYLSKTRRSATVTADGPVSLMRINATLLEQASTDCQLKFYKTFTRLLVSRLATTTDKFSRVEI